MNYILSPCGTSLLTNQADEEDRKLVYQYANIKNSNEIPASDLQKLNRLIEHVRNKVLKANVKEAARLSAELNGIIRLYSGQLPQQSDYHLLLSTDTFLGEVTADLVRQWLDSQNKKFIIEVHRQKDLRTVDLVSFQLALSELVRKLSDELPEFSQKGYRIIFNLTGGFKSIQGFLQSVANFYADETVYIFETSNDLLRIPKLPLRLDALDIVRKRLNVFRRLALQLEVSDTDLQGIADTLLLRLDNEVTFSPWGAVIWEDAKKKLYGEKIYPSPDESKLVYSENFLKTVQGLPSERKVILNERIDQLVKHLYQESYNPASLDFKPLRGKPFADATHEIDAWSDLDARRIFGHFSEGKFILDRLDKGLH